MLTHHNSSAILHALPHCSTGLASRNQTAQAALMRFFYAQKLLSTSLLCRTGQALERVAGYVWPVCQPVQSGTMIGIVLSGFKLTTNEVIIMTNHAINPAISSQTKQSLFNLVKRTPEGPRLQASGLIAEIPGTIALKFSKMGALL